MTKERYRILKPIMDAWLEGKTVQYSGEGIDGWQDYNGYNPDFQRGVWRIKPTLIECWVIVSNDGIRSAALFSKAEAESFCRNKPRDRVVHLVEVPDL